MSSGHPRRVGRREGELGEFDHPAHPKEHEQNARDCDGKVPPGPQRPPQDCAYLAPHASPTSSITLPSRSIRTVDFVAGSNSRGPTPSEEMMVSKS